MNPLTAVERDAASAPFFDAASEGRLVLRKCIDCAHVRGPEVPMCTECLSESFEWITAAGTGHIESWVVLHQRSQPGSVAPEPRIVATVELTEGPWMVSALQGIASSDVTGGMPVVVAFDRPDNSEPIPVFRPANTA